MLGLKLLKQLGFIREYLESVQEEPPQKEAQKNLHM